MTVVYWIHLKEHTDISKEGYVGVTGCFDTRMSRHYSLTSTFPSHFGKAIRKYGWDNLVKEIIFEGLTEECFKKELELRPSFQIGWNEAIGGLGGDRSFYIDYKSRKISDGIMIRQGKETLSSVNNITIHPKKR